MTRPGLPAAAFRSNEEAFRRSFGDDLRVVQLDLPFVTGYEYLNDPGLVEPHIRSFLEEVVDPGVRTSAPAADKAPTIPPGMGIFLAVEAIGPVVPVSAEGHRHLFYELRLTSFSSNSS